MRRSGDSLLLSPSRPHIILCCDCEGTEAQIRRMWKSIERAGVAANFFFVGETARAYPALVREIAATHQVESHTMRHLDLRRMGKRGQRREILDGRRAVEDIISRPTRGFRAPCHSFNAHTVEILNEEGFVFDASRLYYRWYSMGGVIEITPSWFREWMPLYGRLGIRPGPAFQIMKWHVMARRLSVLPAHPHYSGQSAEFAKAFEDFLRWCLARRAVFWPIDKYLAVARGVECPAWISPLGPSLAPRTPRTSHAIASAKPRVGQMEQV